MKRVVSVSLGSPRRNQDLELEVSGSRLLVQRVGAGGNLGYMAQILKDLDGKVDALGLGGINLTLRAGRRRYLLRTVSGWRRRSGRHRWLTAADQGYGGEDLVSYPQEKLGQPRRVRLF